MSSFIDYNYIIVVLVLFTNDGVCSELTHTLVILLIFPKPSWPYSDKDYNNKVCH